MIQDDDKTMEKSYWVYILSNDKNGTLYTGVTADLTKRLDQHQSGRGSGFTHQYKLDKLVYAEPYDNPAAAITREKQLKNWHRTWKIALIEQTNPGWHDLSRSH